MKQGKYEEKIMEREDWVKLRGGKERDTELLIQESWFECKYVGYKWTCMSYIERTHGKPIRCLRLITSKGIKTTKRPSPRKRRKQPTRVGGKNGIVHTYGLV